jgi:hypothetical protein
VREPGTPITSIPYTITQPGYYYLTGDLRATSSGQNGIAVQAQDVTIDLKGYSLVGHSGTGTGIDGSFYRNLIVENGRVDEWNTGIVADRADRILGITLYFNGVAISANQVTIEDCTIKEGGGGIAAERSVVRGCTIMDVAGNGIAVGSGSLIEDNQIDTNAYFTAGSWQIAVTGNDNVIRDNATSRGATGAHFMGIFPGAARNIIIRNRYNDCATGITDNSGNGLNYYPLSVGVTDMNYCQ